MSRLSSRGVATSRRYRSACLEPCSRACRSSRFVTACARGGPLDSCWPQARAASRRSPSGTTRLTMFHRSKVAASYVSAPKTISFARAGPHRSASRYTPPRKVAAPIFASTCANLAPSAAMIRSQASVSSSPAAKHMPWTAAITGNGASSSVLISWNPSANISRACPAVVPAKRWTSAPPQNSGPSACRTRARASSLIARRTAPSSPSPSSMVKVLAGGLAIVTTATSPIFSYFVSIMMLRSACRARLEAFQDGRVGQAAGFAHGLQGQAGAACVHGVDQGGHQPGAAGPERVADGDGAAMDVDFVQVGAGFALPGEHDAGERLVDLEQVDVADGQPGFAEYLAGGRDDGGEHHDRVVGGHGEGVHTCQRGQAQRPGALAAHQQQRRGAVVDLAAVARGHAPADLREPLGQRRVVEGRAEPGKHLGRGRRADALIGVDDSRRAVLAGHRNGRQLAGEQAAGLGGGGALVAGGGEFVKLGAA